VRVRKQEKKTEKKLQICDLRKASDEKVRIQEEKNPVPRTRRIPQKKEKKKNSSPRKKGNQTQDNGKEKPDLKRKDSTKKGPIFNGGEERGPRGGGDPV